MNKASAIGIIGGADGPTAIFVSSRFSPILLLIGAGLLLTAGVLIAFWFSKR